MCEMHLQIPNFDIAPIVVRYRVTGVLNSVYNGDGPEAKNYKQLRYEKPMYANELALAQNPKVSDCFYL